MSSCGGTYRLRLPSALSVTYIAHVERLLVHARTNSQMEIESLMGLMPTQDPGRRSFLRAVGAAGLMAGIPDSVFAREPSSGSPIYEVAQADPESKPKHSIRF